MSRHYDNWERLVAATLKREQFRQLCLAHSRETSIDSRLSDFSFPSPLPSVPVDYLTPSHQFEVNHVQSQALTPEEIFVNGKPLRQEELTILQSCRHPPKKLKPGYYWYDKESGFWGKRGHKPSQIISPHLNVGGRLALNASNGNTKITINGREITKVERRMLKFAGVMCTADTVLWMYEDGSCHLEGQNNELGNIWNRAGIKLLCSILSLPFPPKTSYTSREEPVPEYLEQNDIQKLLLIGCSGSGTSTIFNQAKLLYKLDLPFTEDEIENIKVWIQKNTFGYICILLEGREKFEEENLKELRRDRTSDELAEHADNVESIYYLVPRLKAFSSWLLEAMTRMAADDLSTGILFPTIQEHWLLLVELLNDISIYKTLDRISELERLPTTANYFLESAAEIFRPDYKPSDMDILYAEGSPSTHSFMDLSFPQSLDYSWVQEASLPRYQLIRSSCFSFGDNYRLYDMFEDVRIVTICISLNDYDQHVMDEDGNSVNKMMAGRTFFESIATHPSFAWTNLLLLLTNYDLFEEKIEDVPLYQCDWFNDFNPVTSRTGELAFHYISVKFKKLYTSLTDLKLYVQRVNCLEPASVDAALRYAREIIDWDYESEYFDHIYSSDESIYSDDDS